MCAGCSQVLQLNAIECYSIILCAIIFNCVDFCAAHFRSGGNRRGRQKDYVPTMWSEHFDEKEDVAVDSNQIFRVYFSKRDKQNQKPLLVLLHGGGYSALTWAHFSVNKNDCATLCAIHPLITFVFIVQTEITAIVDCQCLAIDLRGHGDTHVANESDLSANTLAK